MLFRFRYTRWSRGLRRFWSSRTERWHSQLADFENTPELGLLCLLGAATSGLAGGAILGLYGAIQAVCLPLFALFGDHGETFNDSGLVFRLAAPILGALVLGLLVE